MDAVVVPLVVALVVGIDVVVALIVDAVVVPLVGSDMVVALIVDAVVVPLVVALMVGIDVVVALVVALVVDAVVVPLVVALVVGIDVVAEVVGTDVEALVVLLETLVTTALKGLESVRLLPDFAIMKDVDPDPVAPPTDEAEKNRGFPGRAEVLRESKTTRCHKIADSSALGSSGT